MKLAGRAILDFLRRPDPAVRAILVYGPDAGLVRERGRILAQSVVADIADPFRVTEIEAKALADDPAQLADEAAALSLTGGRRVVRITGAADRLSALFADFLAHSPGEALVVVEAGDLPGRSSLRKAFEAAPAAVALPCYGDDPAAIHALIEEMLTEAGWTAERPALDYLKANLGADRGVTRQELTKLVTYLGVPGAGVRLTLEDVEACIGDSAALGLDDLCFAVTGGDTAGVERTMARCLMAGDGPIVILRGAQRHLQRLHLAAALCAAGSPPDAAVRRLRPPLHFKREAAFRHHLQTWSPAKLATALDILTEAEIACKSTGAPDEALCRTALLRIAGAARSPRR